MRFQRRGLEHRWVARDEREIRCTKVWSITILSIPFLLYRFIASYIKRLLLLSRWEKRQRSWSTQMRRSISFIFLIGHKKILVIRIKCPKKSNQIVKKLRSLIKRIHWKKLIMRARYPKSTISLFSMNFCRSAFHLNNDILRFVAASCEKAKHIDPFDMYKWGKNVAIYKTISISQSIFFDVPNTENSDFWLLSKIHKINLC